MTKTTSYFMRPLKLFVWAVLAASVMMALAGPAQAAPLTVTTADDELNSDGDCSLREAIEAANTDAAVDACATGSGEDTINLPSGTYLLTSQLPTITTTVTVDGGSPNPTIDGGNAVRPFVVASGAHLSLNELTLTKGNISFDNGGAIFNEGTLTVSDSTFSGNSATQGFSQGGAIANLSSGTATVSDSTFSQNVSAGQGGGIHNQGSLEVSNSTFSGNASFLFGGGAIRNRAGTLTVNSSTFSGNSAGLGGAILNNIGTATVNGSTLSGNGATAGGAIFNDGVTLTVNDSTLSGNSATGGGGGLSSGGAIFNNSGTATVNNSTVSGNIATDKGGGILNAGDQLIEVSNSTISGNSATEGGGIWSFFGVAALKNTIVANSPTGGNCFLVAVTDGGGNLAWPEAASESCPGLRADPKLGELADNGGPTQTHALQPGSAAINSAVSCPPPSTDQRGVSRPQGAACDIGAYEFEDDTAPVLTVPADITAEATSPDGAVVTFNATAEDDVDGSVAVDCTPASGSTFSLGTTTVSCTAKDASGNTATGSFKVTVQDTQGPVFSGVPSDITGVEATGANGATVTYAKPTASDAVDGPSTVTCSPDSGSTFPLGTTEVTCSASDTLGNTSTAKFKVTVVDTTAPTLDSHADITGVEATGPGGAVVNYTKPNATDLVDGSVDVTCTPAPGATFSLGTKEVSCSATDAAGNGSTETFNVTVVDTTAPSITPPPNITVEATGPDGAAVQYGTNQGNSCSASDIADPNLSLSYSGPQSGSTFPLGTTVITCTVTDSSGNSSSATFTVTVEDTRAPTVLATTPPAGATKVSRTNPNITATFSEPMAFEHGESSTSFTLQEVRVQGPRETDLGDPVSTTVQNPADPSTPNVVRLAPTDSLDKGSYYRVTITTSATDKAGNELQSETTWRFKTAPR